MKPEKSIKIKSRINSFRYAFQGLRHLVGKEPNMLIHFVAAILVVIAGFVRNLNGMQWVAVLIAISLVMISEMFNTCIETLCDLYSKNEYHPAIKIIKDISAGGVLIAAIVSVIIGIIVFTS